MSALLSGGLAVGVLPAPASAAIPNCTEAGWGVADDSVVQLQVPWSSAATSPWNCQLKEGADNDAVRALQRGLKFCYDQSITVDGDFGAGTLNALKAAQKKLGVSQDGQYGPQTRKHFQFAGDFSDNECGELGY